MQRLEAEHEDVLAVGERLVLQNARAGDFKSVFLYVESQPEKVFFSVQLDEGNVKIVIRMLLMKLHRKQMPVQRRPFPVVPVPEHAFLPVHRDFVVAAQEQ